MYAPDVQGIYVAYYGRPADPAGLAYWQERVDNEGGLRAIMQEFGTSVEFTESFGGLNNEQLINAIYMRLFNRDADSAGLEFYLGKLNSGEMTLQTIALNILDGVAEGTPDAPLIADKLAVANEFTRILDENNITYFDGREANQVGIDLIHTVGSEWTQHWIERANFIVNNFGEEFSDVYIQPDDIAAQFLARVDDINDGSYSIDRINDLSSGYFGGGFLLKDETPVIDGIFQNNPETGVDDESYIFIDLQPGNYQLNVAGGSVLATSLWQLSPETGQVSSDPFLSQNGAGVLAFKLEDVTTLEVLIAGTSDDSPYRIELSDSPNEEFIHGIELEGSAGMNASAYDVFYSNLFA